MRKGGKMPISEITIKNSVFGISCSNERECSDDSKRLLFTKNGVFDHCLGNNGGFCQYLKFIPKKILSYEVLKKSNKYGGAISNNKKKKTKKKTKRTQK